MTESTISIYGPKINTSHCRQSPNVSKNLALVTMRNGVNLSTMQCCENINVNKRERR